MRSASCARRLPRRAFECRRFGFGMITPGFLNLQFQIVDSFVPCALYLCFVSSLVLCVNHCSCSLESEVPRTRHKRLSPQFLQLIPTRINRFTFTLAPADVFVNPANRTQAFAILTAQDLSRQGQ